MGRARRLPLAWDKLVVLTLAAVLISLASHLEHHHDVFTPFIIWEEVGFKILRHRRLLRASNLNRRSATGFRLPR